MRAVFGGGHPVTAVGDPDQNIYAWRGASLWNLLTFRNEFPLCRRVRVRAALPLYTNFRSGARILQAADKVIDALPATQRPDPDKLLRPWERQRRRTRRGRAVRARGGGGRGRRRTRCTRCTRRDRVEGLRGAVPDAPAVRALAARVRAQCSVPAEFVNLAGLIHLPEIVEVLAYARAAENPADGVALARILTGPEISRRSPRPRARGRRGHGPSGTSSWRSCRELELDEDDDLFEDHPFLMAEALEHLDEVRGTHRRGTRSPRGVPRRARRAARGGATSRRRVPGRDHPPDRPARRARRHRGPADGARETSQPRRVPRAGARVPTGRGRAHAPRVPRLRRLDRRRPRVEPGAAERRRLGQGDDGARGQGARVRRGVRPGSGERTVPRHADPAEPGAQGKLARRRATPRP